MSNYLLVDFGSTFTKLCAVDIEGEQIIGTSAHFTTVSNDISIGYQKALDLLYDQIGKTIEFERVIACSSAAGGLKMAAIGLVEELTVEAAKRVCLGAGAKVDLVFSHHLTRAEVQKILDEDIDIVLLSGGSDGGNSENVLFNADLLGKMNVKIPVIYAGNKSAGDDVLDIFKKYDMDGYICDNVMPKINKLNAKCARHKIREIFLKQIIEAKGIKKIEKIIDQVMLPTPNAVLKASLLLAEGYLEEEGLGDLVLVDIGGATTDMYSMCYATNRSDVVLHGLEEPYAKRTVEGDLGMRYSAPGILKPLSEREVAYINRDKHMDIEKEVNERFNNVQKLPTDSRDEFIDQFLAEMCAYRAMNRHCGKIREVITPMGKVFNQSGKDLTDVHYVIGTGGVIINNKNQKEILKQTTNIMDDSTQLRPKSPTFLVDQKYIMAPMGLLAQDHPKLALKLMKENLKELK
jgi:uncharacterized protein (TIGR01319 family)